MNLDGFDPSPSWLTAAAVAVAVFLGLLLLREVARVVARRLPGAADDQVALRAVPSRLLARTSLAFPVVIALYAGSLALDLAPEVAAFFRALALIAILLQVALWGSDLIQFWAERTQSRGLGESATSPATIFALRFLATLALWSLLVLLALDNLGIEITALVAGLGIGGIAVALAAQSVLGDFFASLAIVLDQPFVVGDFIVVGDMMGTVERVGIKTTRLRSPSGEQLIFPNNNLVQSRIRNYQRLPGRRAAFSVGLPAGAPFEALEGAPALVRATIEAQPGARFERAHVAGLADGAVQLDAVYYVLGSGAPANGVLAGAHRASSGSPEAYLEVQQAVALELIRRFRAEGVELAFLKPAAFV